MNRLIIALFISAGIVTPALAHQKPLDTYTATYAYKGSKAEHGKHHKKSKKYVKEFKRYVKPRRLGSRSFAGSVLVPRFDPRYDELTRLHGDLKKDRSKR